MSVPLTDAHREALLLEAGVPAACLQEAQAAGFTLAQLLQFLITYGMPFLQFLAKLLGWTIPPLPTPPVVPLKKLLKP